MTANTDRLYNLLPAVYRMRDADQGYPLRALLQVISEQVNVVERDIAQLYENWFIETCQEWVVPYIGGLIGYTPVEDAAQLGVIRTARQVARAGILIPRQEVANTIRFRRRKGTLHLLEDLAQAVAGWPAHAVEFYRRLSVTQNVRYLHMHRGRAVNVRRGRALEQIEGAFDRGAYSVDVRRIDSQHSQGRYNISSVGVFVWRLPAFSVTQSPAYAYEEEGPNCYLFSPLGNDTQLYANPSLDYPTPIDRRDLEPMQIEHEVEPSTLGLPHYYGAGKSLQIWLGSLNNPVTADKIVAADLSQWSYRPLPGQVAVDPKLGRIALPPGQGRKQGVWTSYYYAFSAPIGGGEYERPLSETAAASLYLVGGQEMFKRISDALAQWSKDAPAQAVIEITDSGVYTEQINVTLKKGQTLELRAADRKRPVIRLLDWQSSSPDDLSVSGDAGAWFILDGLLVTGRGLQISGNMAGVLIRHSTLVPGWGMQCNCEPKRPTEPSLELIDAPDCLRIEHSIVGAIQVSRDEVKQDPMTMRISDSIVDACSPTAVALGAPESMCADVSLTIVRSTVFGQVQTQQILLAEDSIFIGTILVCRRQHGCMRFCYIPAGSRTPRRYECQPDLVTAAIDAAVAKGTVPKADAAVLKARETLRVRPAFVSTRYGTPAYCQLSDACAPEILTGASDESEMGVFHDLYRPQRTANLVKRITDFTPAGMDAGIIFAS